MDQLRSVPPAPPIVRHVPGGYIKAIACTLCAGQAHLTHRRPDFSRPGECEIRTFECAVCNALIEIRCG